MRANTLVRITCLGLIAFLAGVTGAAQGSLPPRNLSGLINDYSAGGGGPWHVHADWELHIKGESDKADFYAAVAMVRSDLWVVLNNADPAKTEDRSPHTHHITVADGQVTTLANGIRVTGTANVTGSGNPAFVSPVQIDIVGGTAVAFSNIKVTFSGSAANHFGTLPLDGVVARY
jgi:hypothetical protein